MADHNYNIEATEILGKEALRLPIAKAVPRYEQILTLFPTAARYWKQYVEAHMAVNHDDAVKQIFSRCLLNCLHTPLWRSYIWFIKKVNEKKGFEGQEETRNAFEFMLNYIGEDIGSGPVWMEYIAFLKSLQVQTAQEETQRRMIAVRKAYQRAIITPTHQIEQIWRDYENFEKSVSVSLAKGLLSEYKDKYNSARAVYRERKRYMDEIDWNMLAVPPSSGSSKQEKQWMAWKKILAFEKGNPQRIDSDSANKRIAFTYEQCLMYLYHYPDIWYDYATWHARTGSTDSAIKVFHRALKALPHSEMLKYAYAETEETRGSIQAAKKVYESLLRDDEKATALSHIQFIRFLRRTEGVEAARKYFIDARKSPSCTYHVYVAYAMMTFCLDKDAKFAQKVFEAGLKVFIHEPSYILEYADFLSRLNDDNNIRALFERALSTLPPEKSIEIWKRYAEFEQTYGDLSSMLNVEQRRKEAISRISDDGESILECSLQDVISRYTFKELQPCSSKDLDHLARQELLSKNINKKIEKPSLAKLIIGSADKNSSEVPISSDSAEVVYQDTSKTGVTNTNNDTLKTLPPALAEFVANLPDIEGPCPDVDLVISLFLQNNIPLATGKSMAAEQQQAGSARDTSTRDRHARKRKHQDDESNTVESQPPLIDAFRLRQIQKTRGTPSDSGSAFSRELSGSTG